jgi:predicted SAM-dependent methyltransferase/glycosyltransferase involved in cell wall biosynthesis
MSACAWQGYGNDLLKYEDDQTRVKGFAKSMSAIWLNIGCGKKHLSGFVNMDIKRPYDKKLDARKGLLFADQTVDRIYNEHFLEHLTQAEGLGFLRECRRVLKPSGVVRVAMPDLDDVARRYVSEDWRSDGDMFKLGYDWVANRCEMLNLSMREWGHKHVYNEEELIRIAQMAGLEVTKRYEYGKSDTPELAGRETRNSSKLIMEFTVPDRTVSAAPLVSVLIPAYRATWFQQALQSALSQSYKDIEIIICDDSPDEEIAKIVRAASVTDSRISYARNDPLQGPMGNFLRCLSLAKGEFIKYLNDDDLLAPTCVERMLHAFRKHSRVTLVTSYRKRIDEAGGEVSEFPGTRMLAKKDCEIEGVSCANALIRRQQNFIGEPTTVMFRKSDVTWVKPHLATFGGASAVGAGDVAIWLNLLGRGNAYYIAEPLSSFRIHAGQRQKELPIQIAGQQAWKGFIFHGRRLGLLKHLLGWSLRIRSGDEYPWSTLYIVRPIHFWWKAKRYFKIAVHKFGLAG